MSVPAIHVEEVHKTFLIPHQQFFTIKERVLHPFQRVGHDELHVLDGVSFEIPQGEFFGIVGRNGSGKSTLLKCLAGIYRADSGRISVNGRLAPFIELGVGFNSELTARENVLINAVMMGLSAKQARARFDAMIAFAELEDFVDLKLKNYSSGMQVRLAFAVMIETDADVMLIDEVLAVGDAAFQQKCLDVFYRLRDEGRTILLVTHDMGTVERFCHRAMMLRDGRIELIGDPEAVGRRYLQINFAEHIGLDFQSIDAPAASIREVWCSEADGQRIDTVGHGEPFAVNATIEAHEDIDNPLVELWIADREGNRAFVATSSGAAGVPSVLAASQRLHVEILLEEPMLASERWYVGCAIKRGVAAAEIVTLLERATDVLVYGQHSPQAPMGTSYRVRAVAPATPPASPRPVR
jgi:ABC-type polysaccharide/polyol phosphate transport system ATPase subunit